MGTNNEETQRCEGGVSIHPTPPAPVVLNDVFDHIINNPHVFFKNQQIKDPDLSVSEKETILREVLSKSHCTFLSRFGPFMRDEHLRYFEHDEQTLAYSPDERYEIDYHLERIRRLRNGGRATEVRNRRYAALQKMCTDGTYFSEQEMMHREPLLYEQLVGQYMTEREKQERDARGGPVTSSVVNIIFSQMDREEAKETLQKLETAEYQQEQQDADEMEEQLDSSSRPVSPGFPRAQWGNFDDEEETRLEVQRHERQKKARRRRLAIPAAHLVTAAERNLLRDEFTGIMYARFLAGEDEEFDYSRVDDSLEYDDLNIVEQDEQEKYFDEDENETESHEAAPTSKPSAGEESEDDLDVYMRHLNYHLQQQERICSRDRDDEQICEYDTDE